MYQTIIFDGFYAEEDLDSYLNTNRIKRENIVSISLAADANASERLVKKGVNRILLTYVMEDKK
jgi:hypothetical protein